MANEEKYAVIIQYVFANGEQAAAPWSATINAGDPINQTVNSPDILGYAPDQATVELNETVNGNIYKTVTYHPVNVKYVVEHKFQPVSGSNNVEEYVLEVTEEFKGLTGSSVGAGLELSGEDLPAGFYALLYDTTTAIAANGTTVITVYYDRYFYLMNFVLDGGYGAEPIYARVGAPLNGLIKTPIKAGYSFDGWKATDGQIYTVDTFPYTTMPAAMTVFTAQWTAGNTTFDVVFWYENANDNGYTQAGTLNDVGATAGDKVNGSTYKNTNFTGKDANNFTYSHADADVEVKGDGSTFVNIYFKRNVYTMIFEIKSTNLCTVDQHIHSDDCKKQICTQAAHDHFSLGCKLICDHSMHKLECYVSDNNRNLVETEKPEENLTNLGDGIYTYTTGTYYKTNHYYLNVGNMWYVGTNRWGNKDDETKISLNCSHAHEDLCYECKQIGHIHSASCFKYICNKYEHYHDDGMCYYIIFEKYDADISKVWLSDPIKTILNAGDAFEWDLTDAQVSFLEKMPGADSVMSQYSYSGSRTYHWYYYLELLPNQDATGITLKDYNGKTYYEYDDRTIHYSSTLYLTYDDDYYPITGFNQLYNKTEGGWYSYNQSYRLDFAYNQNSQQYEAYLYYTRNNYSLSFSNYGNIVSGKGGTFLYEMDISGQNFTPDYPATLEPNAYVFEGWYESPFFGDTKFEFDGATMPAKNVTLYARWVPKEHNVNIYLTDEKTDKVGETQIVNHRETATDPYVDGEKPVHPDSDQYKFVGWFYMDGDTEKAFDFSMPITQDIDLYAKWSSNVLVPYVIHYQLANGTPIAPDTTGSALAGSSKTFDAKTGDELNEGFRTGYFPSTQSSCVVRMSVEGTNEFTFIYESKPDVEYTVKYLLKDTDEPLFDEEKKSTSDAIVTEYFKPKAGYMPDAYSKTIVLTADGKTEIIFWYTVDYDHAPVHVVHMIQNAEGEDYTIYQEFTDLSGVINGSYSTGVLNIAGYTFNRATANNIVVAPSASTVTGTVTENGLEIVLYYNRNLYPYEFKFLEQGTNAVLADSVIGTGRYGSQVAQSSKRIAGYNCVSGSVQTITIQLEDGSTAVKNVKIFYYVEQKVDINYVPVGPSDTVDFGTVSPEKEQSIPAYTGTVDGSMPTAGVNFKFVGWYLDEECKNAVPDEWVASDGRIVPQKTGDLWIAATYYAKFEYNLTSLAINKQGHDSIDENQTFLFKIADEEGLELMVTVHGNGSVTVDGLTVGKKYKIVELTEWSWRYTNNGVVKDSTTVNVIETTVANGAEFTLNPTGNEITFTNTRTNDQWLDGDSYKVNIFNGTTESQE